jgi:hypothetical protein
MNVFVIYQKEMVLSRILNTFFQLNRGLNASLFVLIINKSAG